MANFKISQLTGATTPLAGTEVLPIVQSSTTRKVATDDLTVKNVRSNATTGILQIAGPGAGTTRTMTTPNANFTAARTDAAQTFTGIQTFSNSGNENIQLFDGNGPNYGTIQQTGAATYFNGNTTLAGAGSFYWRHTSSYTTIMGLVGSTGNLTLNTGNLVPGTAAKGVNFTANTPAAGMTSQLLNWYEEGTFTPVAQGTSTAGTATYSTQTGQYTRIGNRVFFNLRIIYTGGTGTGNMRVGGLPFTSNSSMAGAVVSIYAENLAGTANYIFAGTVSPNSTYIGIDQVPVGGGGAIGLAYDGAADIALSGHYFV